MPSLNREHVLEAARTMLKGAKYCFLISNSLDGWCSTRLVQPILDEHEDFVVWFGTSPLLRKTREIEANPRVTLAVQNDEEHAGLALYGKATLERDVGIREKRWMDSWQPFFPGGPTGPDYIVIRFEAERLEILNFKRAIAPDPFGLRPAMLLKNGGFWRLLETN